MSIDIQNRGALQTCSDGPVCNSISFSDIDNSFNRLWRSGTPSEALDSGPLCRRSVEFTDRLDQGSINEDLRLRYQLDVGVSKPVPIKGYLKLTPDVPNKIQYEGGSNESCSDWSSGSTAQRTGWPNIRCIPDFQWTPVGVWRGGGGGGGGGVDRRGSMNGGRFVHYNNPFDKGLVFNGILPHNTTDQGTLSTASCATQWDGIKTDDAGSPSGAVERSISLYRRFLYSLEPPDDPENLGSVDLNDESCSLFPLNFSETPECFPPRNLIPPENIFEKPNVADDEIQRLKRCVASDQVRLLWLLPSDTSLPEHLHLDPPSQENRSTPGPIRRPFSIPWRIRHKKSDFERKKCGLVKMDLDSSFKKKLQKQVQPLAHAPTQDYRYDVTSSEPAISTSIRSNSFSTFAAAGNINGAFNRTLVSCNKVSFGKSAAEKRLKKLDAETQVNMDTGYALEMLAGSPSSFAVDLQPAGIKRDTDYLTNGGQSLFVKRSSSDTHLNYGDEILFELESKCHDVTSPDLHSFRSVQPGEFDDGGKSTSVGGNGNDFAGLPAARTPRARRRSVCREPPSSTFHYRPAQRKVSVPGQKSLRMTAWSSKSINKMNGMCHRPNDDVRVGIASHRSSTDSNESASSTPNQALPSFFRDWHKKSETSQHSSAERSKKNPNDPYTRSWGTGSKQQHERFLENNHHQQTLPTPEWSRKVTKLNANKGPTHSIHPDRLNTDNVLRRSNEKNDSFGQNRTTLQSSSSSLSRGIYKESSYQSRNGHMKDRCIAGSNMRATDEKMCSDSPQSVRHPSLEVNHMININVNDAGHQLRQVYPKDGSKEMTVNSASQFFFSNSRNVSRQHPSSEICKIVPPAAWLVNNVHQDFQPPPKKPIAVLRRPLSAMTSDASIMERPVPDLPVNGSIVANINPFYLRAATAGNIAQHSAPVSRPMFFSSNQNSPTQSSSLPYTILSADSYGYQTHLAHCSSSFHQGDSLLVSNSVLKQEPIAYRSDIGRSYKSSRKISNVVDGQLVETGSQHHSGSNNIARLQNKGGIQTNGVHTKMIFVQNQNVHTAQSARAPSNESEPRPTYSGWTDQWTN